MLTRFQAADIIIRSWPSEEAEEPVKEAPKCKKRRSQKH